MAKTAKDRHLTQQDLDFYRKNNIGQSLTEVARHFQKCILDEFSRHGYADLQNSHHSVISNIGVGGTRLTVLAQRAGITKQAMGQLVDEVENLGYVRRLPDPSDGRAKIVVFTDKGQEMMRDALAMGANVQRLYEERMGEEKMAQIRTLLNELHLKIREVETKAKIQKVTDKKVPRR